MTDDHTRRIPWTDDAEAAATASSRHTYPAERQPFDPDAFAHRMVADANRLRRWGWALLLAAGCVACVVGMVVGVVL